VAPTPLRARVTSSRSDHLYDDVREARWSALEGVNIVANVALGSNRTAEEALPAGDERSVEQVMSRPGDGDVWKGFARAYGLTRTLRSDESTPVRQLA